MFSLEKARILRWFTILVIAAFVIEIFVVLTYGQGGEDQSPTPTPIIRQVETFAGVGAGYALVENFTDEAWIVCNSSGNAPADEVAKLPGAAAAYFASSQLIVVELAPGLSQPGFLALAINASEAIGAACGESFSMQRLAQLSFLDCDAGINCVNESGVFKVLNLTAFNQSNAAKQVSPWQITYFSRAGGKVRGLVSPAAVAGEKIYSAFSVKLVNGEVREFFAEQSQALDLAGKIAQAAAGEEETAPVDSANETLEIGESIEISATAAP